MLSNCYFNLSKFTLLLAIVLAGILHGSMKAEELPTLDGDGEEAEQALFDQRAAPLGMIPSRALETAWRRSLEFVEPTSRARASINTQPYWVNLGPAPIVGGQIVGDTVNARVTGRIVDIAVDPTMSATHWFVAATGGGIWETTDAGVSWVPKTDDQVSLATNTITLAPSNPLVLYSGTRDISGMGVGLLKSVDGGTTWTLKSPTVFVDQTFFHFSAVKVHPTDPNTVLAVTSEVYNPGGVFRSTDGGDTFTLQLRGNGTALETNPTDFNQQYAVIRNNFAGFNNSYNGVYRSLDGGISWATVSGPWNISSQGDDVKLAVAKSSPATVYVVVPGGGLWVTQNAWAPTPTWTALPAAPNGETHFDVVMVDPFDATTFYAGGGGNSFYRLSGGGWTSITHTTHVDQHAMTSVGGKILLGNDGGFWTSTDQGTNWTNQNGNLSTIQFYAGALHPTNAARSLGGSQDNGTEFWTGDDAWSFIYGGDGGYCAFSLTNPDNSWLVTAQYLDLYKVTGGTSVTNAKGSLDVAGAAFIAPVRRSPNSDVVLAGSNNLWRTSNFFTASTPTWTSNGPEMNAEIGAIAFAPSDINSATYAFGAGNGALQMTTNSGATWKNLDPAGDVPNRYIKSIAFHPSNPKIVYVSLSGFDSGTPGSPGHIFVTYDASIPIPDWINVTPPVDIPINTLAIDPADASTLYAGADLGIWKTTNAGSSWTFMGPASGMPNTPVLDLEFSPVDGSLFAYTYGRGAFRLVTPVVFTVTPSADANGSISPSTPQTVLSGSSLSFSATPVSGYVVNQWLVDNQVVQAGGNTLFLGPVSADASLQVIFKIPPPKTYSIRALASPSTRGKTYGSGVYPQGRILTVKAVPGRKRKFVNWTENKRIVSRNAYYRFTVGRARTLVAHFK